MRAKSTNQLQPATSTHPNTIRCPFRLAGRMACTDCSLLDLPPAFLPDQPDACFNKRIRH
jgi:hypothetical protein